MCTKIDEEPILRTRRDALQLWGRARLAVSILPFYKIPTPSRWKMWG